MTAGQLRIEREDGVSDLQIGQYAIYSSAQQYGYVNAHDDVTQFVRTVVS